jgi:transglutaminase-like putative cysteine protease
MAESKPFGEALRLLDESDRPAVAAALKRAGKNAAALAAAVPSAKGQRRKALAFLLANMPDHDLRSLSGEFLLANVRLACEARREAPWRARITDELFLDCILPYANLNERRDDWRRDFRDRFAPAAWKCRTPGEAARLLNRTVFKTLGVRYHKTKRPKPDQSPYESTAAGYASCTGLSILLVDACRAAGIPARIAGTPLWTDRSGNHNWVEVWDGGWHYLGAAEPGPLDKTWFSEKVLTADASRWRHRIYAASFRKTKLHFPLAWAPRNRTVPAIDVTKRYLESAARKRPRTKPAATRPAKAKSAASRERPKT